MRKIKFRGRSIRDKRYWLDGGYCWKSETTHCCWPEAPVHHYITVDAMTDWELPNELRIYEVDPETISQYVGMTDRHGKEIYEGDILEASLDEKHPENVTRVEVVWIDRLYVWALRQVSNGECDFLDSYDEGVWSVVGNRWDNPEMMEVEHERQET